MNMLHFDLIWTPSVSADVDHQELNVIRDGVPDAVVTLDKDVTTHSIDSPDAVVIEWWPTAVDDAGNRTPMEHRTFTASDTLAPLPPTDGHEVLTGED